MTDSGAVASTDDGEKATRPRKQRGVGIFIRDIVLIFLAAIIISVGIKTFLIRSFYIPSGSMENTLQINDRIIVNELVPRMVPLKHGDVVVFKDPGGWLSGDGVPAAPRPTGLAGAVDWVLSAVGLSASDSNDHLIKRVIGLPGDKVACCNAFGQLTVNGIPLVEPYITLQPGNTKATRDDFSVTVPKDSLWVMGDNRDNSADSAYHYTNNSPGKGFVPVDDVVGRAFVITWPASHWGWLGDYPDVFNGVESGTK